LVPQLTACLTAQTLMRDRLSMTEELRELHTQMLDITAKLTISFISRGTKLMRKLLKVVPSLNKLKKLHQLPQNQVPNKLQLLIMPRSELPCLLSSIAQISTRDSPFLTDRPEESHSQRPTTTATQTCHLLNRWMVQLVHPTLPLSTAQTLMRDSPSPMERLEASHTHKLATTALPTINSCNQSKKTSHPTLPSSSIAQTSTRE